MQSSSSWNNFVEQSYERKCARMSKIFPFSSFLSFLSFCYALLHIIIKCRTWKKKLSVGTVSIPQQKKLSRAIWNKFYHEFSRLNRHINEIRIMIYMYSRLYRYNFSEEKKTTNLCNSLLCTNTLTTVSPFLSPSCLYLFMRIAASSSSGCLASVLSLFFCANLYNLLSEYRVSLCVLYIL